MVTRLRGFVGKSLYLHISQGRHYSVGVPGVKAAARQCWDALTRIAISNIPREGPELGVAKTALALG